MGVAFVAWLVSMAVIIWAIVQLVSWAVTK